MRVFVYIKYNLFTYAEDIKYNMMVYLFSISLQLHVEDLQETIKYMHENKKYKKVKQALHVWACPAVCGSVINTAIVIIIRW